MELLPIIYLSLAIFAVVAVATIITSFVTYKIRVKTEGYTKPYEKSEDPSNLNYMKRKIMDSDGKFHTVITDGKKSQQKKTSRHQSKKDNIKSKDNAGSKNKNKKTTNRIVIINKPSSTKSPPPSVKEKDEKLSKDLKSMNENILDKYTDDKNEEFYSPTISIKKKTDSK